MELKSSITASWCDFVTLKPLLLVWQFQQGAITSEVSCLGSLIETVPSTTLQILSVAVVLVQHEFQTQSCHFEQCDHGSFFSPLHRVFLCFKVSASQVRPSKSLKGLNDCDQCWYVLHVVFYPVVRELGQPQDSKGKSFNSWINMIFLVCLLGRWATCSSEIRRPSLMYMFWRPPYSDSLRGLPGLSISHEPEEENQMHNMGHSLPDKISSDIFAWILWDRRSHLYFTDGKNQGSKELTSLNLVTWLAHRTSGIERYNSPLYSFPLYHLALLMELSSRPASVLCKVLNVGRAIIPSCSHSFQKSKMRKTVFYPTPLF